MLPYWSGTFPGKVCQIKANTLNIVSWPHTCRAVVAHSEGQGLGGIDIAKRVADNGSTANLFSALPDDLREVAPLFEEGHVGVRLSIKVLIIAHLIVVHQVGDHNSNFICRGTIADVLAVVVGVWSDVSLKALAKGKRQTEERVIGAVHTCHADKHSARRGLERLSQGRLTK